MNDDPGAGAAPPGTPAGEAPGTRFRDHFLIAFVPWAAVAIAAALLVHSYESAEREQRLRGAEAVAVDTAAHALGHELREAATDLLVRAADADFLAAVEAPTATTLERLAWEWTSYLRHKAIYDQIRLLDLDGRELVRVNYNAGEPRAAAPEALQDKARRYYFADTMALPRGGIFVSPLDLNIEGDAPEVPAKPTIRLGTPVFDRHGRKRGALILNYLARDLLDELEQATQGAAGKGLLLNSDGWWLRATDPADEWGFMFAGRPRFSERRGEEWRRMREADGGQFETAGGLWTFRTVYPLTAGESSSTGAGSAVGASRGPVTADQYFWKVVSWVEPARLQAPRRAFAARLLAGSALLLVLIGSLAVPFARAAVRQQRAEGEVRRVNRDLEATVALRTRALRESEARFASLVANAPLFVAIVDRQGRIQFLNRARPGFDAAQAIGTSVYDYIDAGSRAAVEQVLAEVFGKGEPRRLHVLGAGDHGAPAWYETHYGPIFQGSAVSAVAMLSQDITRRLQAERVLRTSEAKYRTLFENAMDAIFVADTATQMLVDANRRGQEMTGRTLDELTRLHRLDLHPPQDRARAAEEFARAAASPLPQLLQLPLVRRDGATVPVEIAVSIVPDADGRTLAFGIFRDISERQLAEQKGRDLNAELERRVEGRTRELATAMRELESFSYSVSHDLRSPLRAIEGFSALLESDYAPALDDKARDYLRRIRRAAQRMAELIDDMLDLARVSRAELRIADVDLSAIAEAIVEDLRSHDPGRRVEVVIAPGLRAAGDAPLLRSALANLLENAWKFTSRRRDARIEFGVVRSDASPAYFVRDNGAGFDMSFAGKLFVPFERLHGPGEYEGTGVGLATVQRIIQRHGGQVRAEGAVGLGATFWFTLGR